MLLLAFIIWITMFAIIQWIRMGFPMNPLAVFVGIWGIIKGAYYFAITQSFWVVLWYAALLISIDIVTPPYFVDVESILAIPFGMWINNHWGLSMAWAVGFAFAAVFIIAASIIAVHFMYARKIFKSA